MTKKASLSYVASYLSVGGIGLAFFPDFSLVLLQSNGEYGDIMPRVAGVLMIGLAGLLILFVRHNDYKYYTYSIYIRAFFVLFFFVLYWLSSDPLFIVLNAIILLGLILSGLAILREKRSRTSPAALSDQERPD